MKSIFGRSEFAKIRRSTALGVLATLFVGGSLAVTAGAAPVAYWRHEEGPAGSNVPAGFDVVVDSTGNFNDMRTFDTATTAATSTTQVSPLALRSGLPNTLALDFGPGGDGDTIPNAGFDDDNYSEGKPINTQDFMALTVELSFRMDTVDGHYQALVGKDGKPLGDAVGEDDSPVQPFSLKIRGDNFPGGVLNQLFVEWIDGDGTLFSDIHFLSTGVSAQVGEWQHVAFTLTATDAQLWVAGETGAYELVDSATGDYAGPTGEVLVEDGTPWTIGRGMFGNGVADWSDAIIDEVRVSDTALAENEFLFLAAPVATEDANFDNDGDVDGGDFLIWQRNFGFADATNLTGDANGDAVVDNADFTIWQRQFGEPILLAGAVPEPAGMLLSVMALAGAALGARSRRA